MILETINMVIKMSKKNKIKGIKRAKYLNHSHLTSGFVSGYLASFFALILFEVVG